MPRLTRRTEGCSGAEEPERPPADFARWATLQPRGLNREQAARYIGVSPSMFDKLVKEKLMPKPKEVRARRIWDRHELDGAFDDLGSEKEVNPWDTAR